MSHQNLMAIALFMGALVFIGTPAVGAPPKGHTGPETRQLLKPPPRSSKMFTRSTYPAVGVTASNREGYGQVSAAPSLPFRGGAGLTEFSIAFRNGDHKLRQISVARADGNAVFGLSDNDGNDPFGASATWYQSRSWTQKEAAGEGSGEFDLAMSPAPGPGYTPVLTGFSFRRADDTDANIRVIGVRLIPDTRQIRVDLLDDEGPDFRGLLNAGTAMRNLLLPFGDLLATLDGGKVLGTSFRRQGQVANARPYRVLVQYAWVPNTLVTGHGAISGSGRNYESGQRPPARSKPVLQGFMFAFANSDHHLQQLMIRFKNPDPHSAFPGYSSPEYELVGFQDENRDDPIQWYVDWVSVK